MLTYPNFDPVALSFGSLEIRWYGIAYVAGILGGWWLCAKAIQRGWSTIPAGFLGDFFPWATVGIILGGRLGHALFYEFSYYSANPLEIFMIWRPGMSFHGGLIGVIVAGIILSKKHQIRFLELGDLLSIGAPIGFFFGRVANFINAELWGRITDVPWAMVFPGAGPYPRHPSQLYEALLEGPILLIVQLYILNYKAKHAPHAHGLAGGSFLFFYGLFRFLVEFVREPLDGFVGPFTAGQFYTLPMIALGLFFFFKSTNKKKKHD